MFYEMLTGELPLGRFAPPSQKAQIDVRLDEVVLRALEKEPERRYQHASEVKTDVESISGPAVVQRGQPPTVRPISKARWLWLVGALSMLLLWIALGNLIRSRHSSSAPAPAVAILKSFTSADKPISADLIPTEDGGWLASSSAAQTFRLFE